jgi:hypothetical protein
MKAIIQFFKNLFLWLIGSVVGSIVGSIMLLMAVGAIVQRPIVTMIVGAAFLPFHGSDIRGFYEERRWALMIIRYVLLCAISSFLVGLFGVTLGFVLVESYLIYTLLIALPTLLVVISAYLSFAIFLPKNSLFVSLNTWLRDQESGGKAYGIWWDY